MPTQHPLFRKPTRNTTRYNGPQENQAAAQALNKNQYVAEIFVGRRKVWETRAATRDQAFSQAKAQETQYSGANPEIKVKQVKPVK